MTESDHTFPLDGHDLDREEDSLGLGRSESSADRAVPDVFIIEVSLRKTRRWGHVPTADLLAGTNTRITESTRSVPL